MKALKHLQAGLLTLATVLALWGCSDKVTGVTEDVPTFADNSSSSEQIEYSSSSIYDVGCLTFASKRLAPQETALDKIIESRVKTLKANGVNETDAVDSATFELLKAIGLDTLLASNTSELLNAIAPDLILASNDSITLEDVSDYFEDSMDSALIARIGEDLAEDGTLESLDICKPFSGKSYGVTYTIVQTCGRSTPKSFIPIRQNIWRKCVDNPYCDSSRIGEIRYAGNEAMLIPIERYECREYGWEGFTDTTKVTDVPCDENNKRIANPNHPGSRREFLVCFEGKWYPSNEWTHELPAEYYFNPEVEYGSFEDPRDGHVYRTVEVNGRTWMAENILYQDSTFNADVGCIDDSCKIGGRFYTAPDASRACPEGWRIPTNEDFESLGAPDNDFTRHFSQIGGTGSIINISSTNESGLTFLPIGDYSRDTDNHFWKQGEWTLFWSREKEDENWKYYTASIYSTNVYFSNPVLSDKPRNSVRCIKD